ncbi:EamA family transporter [Streptomyces sp. NPDC059224]|uniref:EamA family transporter n=1 Tax=Streptomyces sp. NPDC059224 TaxID=3346775 RepID=UPI003682C187
MRNHCPYRTNTSHGIGVSSVSSAWLPTPRGALVVLQLGAVTTFLWYWLLGYGLRHTTAQIATALPLTEPAVAAVPGVAVLGERLPAVSWCGLAVPALGIVLLTLPAKSRGRRR